MSKEKRMLYNGKKYVTKIGTGGCEGCVFFRGHYLYFDRCGLCYVNTGCFSSDYSDGHGRIWVKDTTVETKDHIWVIEYYDDFKKEWYFYDARNTRKEARCSLPHKSTGKVSRIRKYAPVK